MKNKKEKVKNFIHFLKEAWKDERKRAIIMLILMFFFFCFVIISIRTTNKNLNNEISDNEEKEIFDFSLSQIKNGIYHFIYSVTIDNNQIIYEGDTENKKEIFSINSLDKYYKYGDKYLKDIRGVWSTIDNPYLFSEFKDIDNIEQLLKQASFDSMTEYKDNNKIYNYNISTTTIIKELEKLDIDIGDIPNTISITTDSNDNVVEINYNLSSYSIYKNMGSYATICIKYFKFGEIEEIEDPK